MGRWLTWVSHQRLTGWACSQCGWTFPVPSMLTDKDAKSAYDRLASSKFQEHDCALHGEPAVLCRLREFRGARKKAGHARLQAKRRRPDYLAGNYIRESQ